MDPTNNLNETVAKTNNLIDSTFVQVIDRLELAAKDSGIIANQFAIRYADTDDTKAKEAYKLWKKRTGLAASIAQAMLTDPMISVSLKERIIRSYPAMANPGQPQPVPQRQLPAPHPQGQPHHSQGLSGPREGTIVIDESNMPPAPSPAKLGIGDATLSQKA
jgi:hypothetical protein